MPDVVPQVSATLSTEVRATPIFSSTNLQLFIIQDLPAVGEDVGINSCCKQIYILGGMVYIVALTFKLVLDPDLNCKNNKSLVPTRKFPIFNEVIYEFRREVR